MWNHPVAAALLSAGGFVALGLGAGFIDRMPAGASGPAVAAIETVTLQPGSFTLALPGEFLRNGHPVSAPRVAVAIDRPIEIMKYQVAAADYRRCVEARACRPAEDSGEADVPATGVSHIDAQAYAAWYSRASGEAWRLPTDAEWAYAAAEKFRGDIESEPADPANPAKRWLSLYRNESALDRRPDPQPRRRGSFGANSNGVADIAGNVWEWTSSCYVHATIGDDGKVAPGALDNCGVHVVEGFHRTYMSNFIRDGKSGGCAVGRPPDNLGFRLVRERLGLAGRLLRFVGLS